MGSGSYIQKDTIQEKHIRFNIEMLAPREAEIKEEFAQSFILNLIWAYQLLVWFFSLFGFILFLLNVVSFIFKFFDALELIFIFFQAISFRIQFLLLLRWVSVKVWLRFPILALSVPLNLLSFNINLPIFKRTLLRAGQIEVQNQTLLYPDIQIKILLSI